jgi:hypothetical protein
VLDVELLLEAPARLKQPIAAVLGDRSGLALALGVQRAAPFAHPRPTALRADDELAGIELDARRHARSLAKQRTIIAIEHSRVLKAQRDERRREPVVEVRPLARYDQLIA